MKKPTSVEKYIASFPKEVQGILQTIRETINDIVPDGKDVISYGIPAVAKDGKCIIYYSAWRKHMSLYPYTESMIKAFKESVDYKTSGKGTIQFPFDKPLPLSLIRKIARFRLQEARKPKESKS